MKTKRTIENMHHTVYELVIPEELRTVEAYRYIGVHSSKVAFLFTNYWGTGTALKGMGMKDIAERFVLKTFATRKEAEEYEIYLQKKVNAACNPKYFNLTNGPPNKGGRLGVPHTEETKAKMRIAKSNISEETRAKMSEGQKGRTFSVKTRAKMSEGQRGKTLSDETKAKISKFQNKPETKEKKSKAYTGKKRSPETIAKLVAFQNKPETKVKQRKSKLGRPVAKETRKKISETLKKLAIKAHALAKERNCTFYEAKKIITQ